MSTEKKKGILRPGRLFERLARQIDIPISALGKDFFVEMYGGRNVVVFGCQAILVYAEEKVVLRIPGGCLDISGRKLEIGELVRDCVTIAGQIDGVKVMEESVC